MSLEYVRPLFVKTKNLFLKFLKPSLLLPCALFTNILQETRIFYTKICFYNNRGIFHVLVGGELWSMRVLTVDDIQMMVLSVLPHSIV